MQPQKLLIALGTRVFSIDPKTRAANDYILFTFYTITFKLINKFIKPIVNRNFNLLNSDF